jgi:predicted nucleic acid-binding protein
MSKKLKIYLDTSVINFLVSEQSPEKREITTDFFENYVLKEKYDIYISSVVISEILNTKDIEKRTILLDIIAKYPIKTVVISESDEISNLAQKYLEENVIPKKNVADALHIAISVINNIDILLSWNYKHLANFNRKRRVININLINNYFYPLDILTPYEVLDYGND